MKQKNIKVVYTYRTNYDRYGRSTSDTCNPKIQMEGKWLDELGFHIGDRLLVEYEDGKIVITPAPADKPAPMMVAEEPVRYSAKSRRKKS